MVKQMIFKGLCCCQFMVMNDRWKKFATSSTLWRKCRWAGGAEFLIKSFTCTSQANLEMLNADDWSSLYRGDQELFDQHCNGMPVEKAQGRLGMPKVACQERICSMLGMHKTLLLKCWGSSRDGQTQSRCPQVTPLFRQARQCLLTYGLCSTRSLEIVCCEKASPSILFVLQTVESSYKAAWSRGVCSYSSPGFLTMLSVPWKPLMPCSQGTGGSSPPGSHMVFLSLKESTSH